MKKRFSKKHMHNVTILFLLFAVLEIKSKPSDVDEFGFWSISSIFLWGDDR